MLPPDQLPPTGVDPSAFDFTNQASDSLAARLSEEQQRNPDAASQVGDFVREVAGAGFDLGTEVGGEVAGAVIEGTVEVASAGVEIAGEAVGALAEAAGGCLSGCCVLLALLFLGASTVIACVW